jgi:hypothetical protein
MALQQINVGASANDNTGDPLRTAFQKVNANTTDLLLSISTSYDSVFNGVKVGKGGGNVATNTSLGNLALSNNTGGSYNSAVGIAAMKSNGNGFFNTAIGGDALFYNIDGDGNTAIGKGALQNSLADNNTAVGVIAGSNNINLLNTLCLGYNAQANASNQVNLGDTAISSLRCNVQVITSLSDERDKTDILEISEGIDFISKLKPVTFTWNQRDGNRVGVKSAGFIAQDLLKLQNDSLIGENLDLVSETDSEKLEARYANLMPVMIKAIQELKKEIELLKSTK